MRCPGRSSVLWAMGNGTLAAEVVGRADAKSDPHGLLPFCLGPVSLGPARRGREGVGVAFIKACLVSGGIAACVLEGSFTARSAPRVRRLGRGNDGGSVCAPPLHAVCRSVNGAEVTEGTDRMKRHIWRTGTVLVVLGALVRARRHLGGAGRVALEEGVDSGHWTDHDRPRPSRRSRTSGPSAAASESRSSRSSSATSATTSGRSQAADAPDVVVARTTGRARSRRTARRSAVPELGEKKQFPQLRARRVLVRQGGEELYGAPVAIEKSGSSSTRSSRRCRRPGPSSSGGARVQAQEVGQPRDRRPAGRERRRVPHVPVLLGPRRLRLRPEPRGQPRFFQHRRRNPAFLKNAKLIDKWNQEGLINSKVDSTIAKNAFLKKQAAF